MQLGFFEKFLVTGTCALDKRGQDLDSCGVKMGVSMARKSGMGAGWDPVTKVFVILAFIGSFIYIASMLNDSINETIKDSIGIDIQGP